MEKSDTGVIEKPESVPNKVDCVRQLIRQDITQAESRKQKKTSVTHLHQHDF